MILDRWYYRFGGRLWPTWQAYIAYFRDIVDLDLSIDDTWDRSRAYDDAQSAGWWWPFKDFAMVCGPPSEIHLEQVGPPGWGSHRLHREDGPAIAWPDGWGVHSWHGVRVPADLIENGWDINQIMAERNTEIRRCAIEKMGWDTFVHDAQLKPVDETADPGNPGQMLRLFDLPRDIMDLPVRILLCVNGTPERDGARRTYGLTVPNDCGTALQAAAWTYGLTAEDYAAAQIRT